MVLKARWILDLHICTSDFKKILVDITVVALNQWFSSRGLGCVCVRVTERDRERFCHLTDIWQHLETFLIVTPENAIGIQWVEVRDAAKHPTTQRTVPTTKNYPVQNDNSAEIEKTCSRSLFPKMDLLGQQ